MNYSELDEFVPYPQYFQFSPPQHKEFTPFKGFISEFSDPYDIIGRLRFEGCYLHCKFHTTKITSTIYEENGMVIKRPIEYRHTLVEMTEFDVNQIFFKRALQYYDIDKRNNLIAYSTRKFLDFHFSSYSDTSEKWLDHISTLVNDIHKYVNISEIVTLRFRKLVNDWVERKREELAELKGLTVNQISSMNTLEENEESSISIEKTTHKLVLLHELGVIECLQKVRKEKNPNLSDTQFAELVGSILGLQGKQIETVRKGISGYGRGGKDDPKTAKAFTKVKSELIKFGIEIS